MYEVLVKRKVLRDIQRMPDATQKRMAILVDDLRDRGPIRAEWPSFSRLGKNRYHCHVSHRWVACWSHERNSIAIEVYYAGSRENAPY